LCLFIRHLLYQTGHAVYRQQRWNKIDTELLPKVSEELQKCEDPELAATLLETFGLGNLVESFVINLSNGEQRKLELVRALAEKPDLLVLDNAFTGLDRAARPLLANMLETLISHGQTLVMTGLELSDFPPSVNRFLVLGDGRVENECSRNEVQPVNFQSVELLHETPDWTNSVLMNWFI
jgi:molybdate transport system ATP-binding protein